MTMLRFSCQAVPQTYNYLVRRWSVFYPLMGVPKNREILISGTLQGLVGLWRGRVDALVEHGWQPRVSPRASELTLQNLKNCRPSMLLVQPPNGFPCSLQICPFCYARRVSEVWKMFEPLFVAAEGRTEYLVLERVARYTVSRYGEEMTEEAAVERLRSLLRGIPKRRGAALKVSGAVGGWQFSTVEPTPDRWRVRTRQILLYRPADTVPTNLLVNSQQYQARLYEHVTRWGIAQIVGRVCAYPRLWLRSEPPEMVMLLQALADCKPRLAATFGVLRKDRIHEQPTTQIPTAVEQ